MAQKTHDTREFLFVVLFTLLIILANAIAGATPNLVPRELFTVPPGFEVTIWAQSPQLRNPTNIDIDAHGRIWVAEGSDYRQHASRDPNGDRIVVLEDTDRDGRADQSTVFVQEAGLVAPLGVAVVDNKVYVSNSPDLIVYTDVDRNLKFDPAVDRREVLLSGFGGRNHDHGLHSVTFGPDGRLYFNEGNMGALVTDRSGWTFRAGGADRPFTPWYSWQPADLAGAASDDGRIYSGGFAARVDPDGTHLQIIGYNFRNSYEQTVSSFGDVFQNDNDDPPACRTTFLMEHGNLGYFSADGKRRWNADRRPGQAIPVAEWRQEDPGVIPAGDVYGGGAPTGIVLYEGDALGPRWRGLLLSAEAARNTILGYLPQPDGAGYRLEHFNFLTTNPAERFAGTDFKGGEPNTELQTYFRPSDVAVGPDGAVYIADWFDPRVGGHEDLDDTTSGALYRIAPKGARLAVPKFDAETVEGQLTALKSPAVNVRAIGFMRLKARGGEAVDPVSALLRDANPYVRARAVFLLAQLGPTGIARVESLLVPSSPQSDALMRVAAFRALTRAGRSALAYAEKLARDPSPAVRREVALSLRDIPFAQSRESLLALAEGYDGKDRSYLEAWGIGASGKEAQLYAALRQTEANPVKWPAAYANLVWRLTPVAAVDAFAARAASAKLSTAERNAAVTALGFIPTREAAWALLDLAEQGPRDIKSNQALWWLLNYKDSRWAGQGIDAALKRRGLYDPDSILVSEAVVPAPPARSSLPSVAEIARLTGHASRGARVSQACLMCHRIGKRGTDYAPVLTGFASRQTKEVMIGAIVDPSADIAHGYEGTELVTHDGLRIDGLLLSRGDPYVIQSTGGVVQMIPASRVAARNRFDRSLMLSAAQLGLTAQDVADVVAYLKTQDR